MPYTGGMASKTVRAADYLAKPEKYPPRPVCVAFGDEPFFRREVIVRMRRTVLGGDEGDFSFSAFEGGTAELADVLAELATVAMFGDGTRLVVVEGADEFVSRYRGQLEDYTARPTGSGVLLLELQKSFPANTRLYKAVAADGLPIDCSALRASGVVRWLTAWAQQAHRAQLTQAAAETLVELIGPELGLLDQEVAKLALLTGADKRITPELVGRAVGGWRVRTAWEMLDAAMAGDVRGALMQLDRLLASGESPIGVLGQISATLRRFAAATRMVIDAEAAGRRVSLQQSLERAGVRSFVLRKAEQQLRRLGRQRGAALYRWLLQADLGLKGDSALPPRLVLERLVVRLAARREVVGSG